MTWGSSAPGLPCGKGSARDLTPNKGGYVTSKFLSGEREYIHRHLYEAKHDESLEGRDAHHMCGNRWCANPDHIEPMDRVDHMQEHENAADYNRQKTHCPQGHPYFGNNLVINSKGSRECRTCRNARERERRERLRRN